MTVKQLKAILADLPDETLVVLASDVEGNTFSPVSSCTPVARYVNGRRSWEVGTLHTPGDPAFEAQQGQAAVVVWPSH